MSEKYDLWKFNNPLLIIWLKRIIQYLGLFLIIMISGFLIFLHYGLFYTNIDNARYLLSALLQSQAAIIAIVITLTLIAFQMAASAYTPRVAIIYRNNPDMWILLFIYIIAITDGLILLKFLKGNGGNMLDTTNILIFGGIPISIEILFSLNLIFGFFSFFALIFYMITTTNLLKSESITKKLVDDITFKNVDNFEQFTSENPLIAIFDLIYGSILKYDFETMRNGLNAVIIKFYLLKKFENRQQSKIDLESFEIIFFTQISDVSRLIREKSNEKAIEVMISALRLICTFATRYKLLNHINYSINEISTMGFNSAKNALNNSCIYSLINIDEIYSTVLFDISSYNKQGQTLLVYQEISRIEENCKSHGLTDPQIYCLDILENIAKIAIVEERNDIFLRVIEIIVRIGMNPTKVGNHEKSGLVLFTISLELIKNDQNQLLKTVKAALNNLFGGKTEILKEIIRNYKTSINADEIKIVNNFENNYFGINNRSINQ